MPKITDEKLKLILTGNGSYNPLYSESVKLYNEIKVHADGICPDLLIQKRRPSESEEILQYRKDIYEPITKLPISQVINCYSKIRRSPDWMLNFSNEKISSKISDDNSLEKYCNEKLPGFVSITNWAFDILLPQNLIDANAVVAVIPLRSVIANEYNEPTPMLFNCDQVLYFDEKEKCCVLQSRIKVNFMNQQSQLTIGDKYFYIDDEVIIVYEQRKEGFTKTVEIVNTTKQFPVFKLKSEAYKQYDGMTLNRSRLHAMVPFLNKAATGDSDLEGSKIQHLYPLFWYFQNKDCNSCNGTGKKLPVAGSDAPPASCESCSGGGKVKFSPFAHIQVDPAGIGNQANPVPPAGYIQKDTTILELQEKTNERNNYKALCAMNMQFLDQSPLNTSGLSKQVDKEELNNTVYNTAEDIVYAIDKVIFFINEWRYGYLIQDPIKRKSMLPQIPVPQNYDLLPEDYLMKEVSDARNAKVNPFLIATMEQELAAKKFYNKPQLAKNTQLYFDLDPLPGYSVDEKMSLLTNKAITMEDFIISSYAAAFIKRALRENAGFEKLDYTAQMEILKKFAAEKVTANDNAATMIDTQKQQVLAEMNSSASSSSSFKIGDTVMVKNGLEHMPSHKGVTFTVAEIQGDTYALKLPNGSIHKWYTGQELMSM